ncbi:MAG: hypothetical protein A3B37_02855 [Candidatus Sungbacteria bacterium RIFCSPLOWO2_01_FULL_59_16]|uniref:Uncharacterized protein n=1 Tax=Candidatus Sungbacteria bacterium RIFCSPLOWO2_01_FULL_59_16 TaxID=1802280 RepID=A0A1G2L9I1_9BACT|nr:MAG: hypothetical protein A3B37_02855 [Candidatus Sungbacteria bacterium RIFCSPLOWO2_01_FULL_59_16]
MRLPAHPFFAAAKIVHAIPPWRILGLRSAFATVPFLLLGVAVVTASGLWFGIALVALACYLTFYLWTSFLSFYDGQSLMPLPKTPEQLASPWFRTKWPRFVDFTAAGILATVPDTDDPRAILEGIFRSRFGAFFFARTGIDREQWFASLRNITGEGTRALPIADLMEQAASVAMERRHESILVADILAAVVSRNPSFQKTILAHDLSPADFEYLADWLTTVVEHHREGHFVDRLLASPGIGKSWGFGYTVALDRASSPVRAFREDELHILAHVRSIRETEEALAKSASANALLIGPPGVGKMTVVRGLAERIRQGASIPSLNYRRVVRIAMENIVGEQSFGSIVANLERIFRDAERAGNVILVIEDIELYLAPGSKTAVADALLPFLRSPAMKVVGLTTPEGFAQAAATYPVVNSVFHEVRIAEPDEETVMQILGDVALAAETKHARTVQYQTLKKVYALSLHYLAATPFPEKAVNLLEETFIYAKETGSRVVTPDMVEKILARKFGAVIGRVEEGERKILVNLETELAKRVIGQTEALRAIADAIRRKRSGVAAGSKPIGSFLFLGPTGVGKTETAKALAHVYFGSEEAMIRIDMTEYQNPADLGRLIGSLDTREVGHLIEEVRAHPFSLLLLDEIEKAHPNVLNLFLRILDEGRMTDAFGKPVDFTNTFIIATSNAGSEFIREGIAANMPYVDLQRRLVEEVLQKNIFRPEFVNRFDAVIVYTPLSADNARQVARLFLERLRRRLMGEGYDLSWTDAVLDWLAKKGYSPVFGGRELRRFIQDRVEATIARDILAGKYRKGDTIPLVPQAEIPSPPPLVVPPPAVPPATPGELLPH